MAKRILKKSVVLAGKTYQLFSLDGNTWSSNMEELAVIENRLKMKKEGVRDSLTGQVSEEALSDEKTLKIDKTEKVEKIQKMEVTKAKTPEVVVKAVKTPVANKRPSSSVKKVSKVTKKTVSKKRA